MSEEITRRKLLRVGAGTAALGAVGSLSGCSAVQDLIPGGGGGLGNYSNWVYEPDTFESDARGLFFNAFSPKKVLSNSGEISESYLTSVKENDYPQLGINSEDIAMSLSVPNGEVIEGSFDAESIKTELKAGKEETTESGYDEDESDANNEFESETTYNDNFEIFVRADMDEPTTAFGIGDGTIVKGNLVPNTGNESDPVSAQDVVEGIIDTGTNGDDRLVDSNENFKALTDAINTGTYAWGRIYDEEVGSEDGQDEDVRSGQFDGVVGRGGSTSINGDTTKIQKVFVYNSDGDVDEGDLEEWIEANDTGDGSLSNLHDISISTNSNTATVSGTMDTIEYP